MKAPGYGEAFQCAVCGGVFRQAWSAAEARAERARRYGVEVQPTDKVVCEGCFNLNKEHGTELVDAAAAARNRTGPTMQERHRALRELLPSLAEKIAGEGSHYEWDSSGYRCFMLRTEFLSWCGYVSVSADHPWHGLSFDAYVTPLPERDAPMMIAPPVISMFLESLRALDDKPAPEGQAKMDLCVLVHGGLTWSGPRSDLPLGDTDAWTFGFDCGHAGDVIPGLLSPRFPALFEGDTYRDRDYVIGETSRLAAQLRIVHRRGYR